MRAVPQGTVNALALAFIVLQIVYVLLYLGNRRSIRSMVWSAAFVCNLTIFFSPLWAGKQVNAVVDERKVKPAPAPLTARLECRRALPRHGTSITNALPVRTSPARWNFFVL